MKRIIAIAVSLIIAIFSCTSCFTMMAIASANATDKGNDLGKEKASFVLTTFQKVSPYAALATTKRGDVVCVIAKFDRYYDGLVLRDKFICKGTYTYTSIGGAERNVLVYAYKQDMKDLQSVIEQFLKEKPKVVVDDKNYMTI